MSVLRRRVVVTAIVLGAWPAWGAGSGATTAPAADPALAGQFLSVGKAALAKGQPVQAAAAFRQTVRYDPSLLEARFLLARACQAAGLTREAIDAHQDFLKALEGETHLPASSAGWRAAAEAQLRALCVHLRQWEDLRRDHARQFRALAAGQGGMPSCVRALEAAIALDPQDAEAARQLELARRLTVDVLAPVPEKPNPEGARLLAGRAADLAKAGKVKDALRLLESASALSRDAETLADLAEGYLVCRRPAEAALAASEGQRLLIQCKEPQRRALAPRLENALHRADPNDAKVSLLFNRFAAQAEALARAAAGKDRDTAEEIVDLVLKLLPDRPSAQALADKLNNAAPAVDSLPNIAHQAIRCVATPNLTVQRTARCLHVKGKTVRAGEYVSAGLIFNPLRWGKSLRVTWRVQQLSPPYEVLAPSGSPAYVTKYGNFTVAFWPVGEELHPYRDLGWYMRSARLGGEDYKSFLSTDMTYDITCEKEGLNVRILVNGRVLKESKLTPEEAQAAAKRSVGFKVTNPPSGLPVGHPFELKATLLEFSCSPDCVVQN